MNIKRIVDNAIELVIKDFKNSPESYFSEEDVRWRLMREIDNCLPNEDKHLLHGEYPTPFRCEMENRSFKLKKNSGSRGHFDIVVLNKEAVKDLNSDIKRAQDYDEFQKHLRNIKRSLPFLDCVIEIKLFRECIKSKQTDPAKKRMQEYASQSFKKILAAFQANDYYSEPFAKYGVVFICDASELSDKQNWRTEVSQFVKTYSELPLNPYPDRISLVWVIPQK